MFSARNTQVQYQRLTGTTFNETSLLLALKTLKYIFGILTRRINR
jgi:hypothetical protein